jgi:archaemetzincin
MPKHALVYAGIVDVDLFRPDLNFVFGLGSLKEGVGVYSFCRYGGPGTSRALYLKRACKVLNHEIGHIFGLAHCIYYDCGMNGFNSLREGDEKPIHYCPVCLHKLWWNLGFDVIRRYERLAAFYRKHGLEPDARWVEERILHLQERRTKNFWEGHPP